MPELESLQGDRKRACPIEIKATMADKAGKVNLLLQVYVSRKRLEGVLARRGLVVHLPERLAHLPRALRTVPAPRLAKPGGDAPHPVQGGGRSASGRISTRCANSSTTLSPDTLHKLEERKATVERLWDMSPSEIGSMLRLNTDVGRKVKACVEALPHLGLDATVQPITRSVLRVQRDVDAEFRVAGPAPRRRAEVAGVGGGPGERAHLSHRDVHAEQEAARGRGRSTWRSPYPSSSRCRPQYFLRATSEHVARARRSTSSTSRGWCCRSKNPPHTDLLDLTPLPQSALNNPAFEALYERKFTHFNAIQTQAFLHALPPKLQRASGRPHGVRKTISAELAMMKVFRDAPAEKMVYIAPLKALVRERIEDWRKHLCPKLGKRLVELTGDYTPDLHARCSTRTSSSRRPRSGTASRASGRVARMSPRWRSW